MSGIVRKQLHQILDALLEIVLRLTLIEWLGDPILLRCCHERVRNGVTIVATGGIEDTMVPFKSVFKLLVLRQALGDHDWSEIKELPVVGCIAVSIVRRRIVEDDSFYNVWKLTMALG
jgi:hypothetical protein